MDIEDCGNPGLRAALRAARGVDEAVMAEDAGESLELRNEGSRGGWDEDDGCPKSSTCVFDGVEGTVSEEGSGKREALACEVMIVAETATASIEHKVSTRIDSQDDDE